MIVNSRVFVGNTIVGYVIDSHYVSKNKLMRFKYELSKFGIRIMTNGLLKIPYKTDRVTLDSIQGKLDDIYIDREVENKFYEWKYRNSSEALLVQGARQVGKTSTIKHFTERNYKNVVYISMNDVIGKLFEKDVVKISSENTILQNVVTFCSNNSFNYTDDGDTVLVLDEIQESILTYNSIRKFTRVLKCNVIITGSYLGILVSKYTKDKVFFPIGDLHQIKISPLSFKEFCKAVKIKYRQSKECMDTYEIYRKIGGYPGVVKEYLRNNSIDSCILMIQNIWNLYQNESQRYFKGILYNDFLSDVIAGVIHSMLSEKSGVNRSITNKTIDDTINRVITLHSLRLDKKKIADYIFDGIAWLNACGIIGECPMYIGKIIGMASKTRYYICDVGLASYFCRIDNADESNMQGFITENFVYTELCKNLNNIYQKYPYCYVDNMYEIDFLLKDYSGELIGIEVKTTNSKTKSLEFYRKKKYIKYAVKAAMTRFSIDNSGLINWPVYLVGEISRDNILELVDKLKSAD